jgi:putative peptidoglycan lipid II flippase
LPPPPARRFLKALGPAIIGAGGVQLALFADTLIASFLPTGALSALYYADRINQLPIGVVGIAVGTVLLPEMSRRLAAGDEKGAACAQARGIQLALLLTIPCAAAAMTIPDLIMRALFARGAFTVADAAAAGGTLAAYSIGLLPFVLLRSFTAPFYARGDTATPVKAALLAAAINIALKVVLMGPLAQVGLALATSVGAWINLTLLAVFARRQGFAVSGAAVGGPVAKLIAAGVVLAAALLAGAYGLERALAGLSVFREETMLALLVVLGAIVYGLLVLVLLGRPWFKSLLREVTVAADTPAPPNLETPDPTDDSSALPDNEPPPKV